MNSKIVEELQPQPLILKEVQNSLTVSQHQKKITCHRGDDPLNSLDTAHYFYFVMSGKLKIYQLDLKSARELTLYILSRGDMFDVVSLLDGSQNEYISEVLEECELIQVPLEEIKQMVLDDTSFRQLFYSYLASKLKSMENLAVSLSFYDVYHRVLQLFTHFTYMKDNKPALRIIDNLKDEEIASLVGSVRKVVNRALQKLKKDGVIELSRKKIQIKNFQKLLDKLSS